MIETLEKKNVKEIVKEWLIRNNYDGLCNSFDCGCSLDDFIPCMGQGIDICQPGFKDDESDIYSLILNDRNNNLTVKDIVKDWLLKNNYDALWDGSDCMCCIEDLMFCEDCCLQECEIFHRIEYKEDFENEKNYIDTGDKYYETFKRGAK